MGDYANYHCFGFNPETIHSNNPDDFEEEKVMAYEVKGRTTKITATSRCAIKIKDNYYTLELSEERLMPESSDIDLNEEYRALFDSINSEIDNQCQDIINSINNKR